MKSKLLKKLRKQFAAQYQVRFEVSDILPGYHPFYALYEKGRSAFTDKMQWQFVKGFQTEAAVKEYLRDKYIFFIEDYLTNHRTKRLRNKLTYPW